MCTVCPSPEHPPGAFRQSWDMREVSVGTFPGLLRPSEGWHLLLGIACQPPGCRESRGVPCHQVPSRTSLVLLPLGGLLPTTKLGRRQWGWQRGGRKAIALSSSEPHGPEDTQHLHRLIWSARVAGKRDSGCNSN